MTSRDTSTSETLLPIGDVARRAGVSVDTVREWDRTGALTSIRTHGGHRRFRLADVERYLAPPIDEATPALAEGGDAA